MISSASACRPSCHRRSPRLRSAAAQQRGVFALLADPKRGGQRAVGGVESFEQRREVALAQIDLREPRGASVARQVRNQRVDDLLLPRAEAERFAHALLLEQQVRRQIVAAAIGRRPTHSSTSIERGQRIRELAERDRPLRRAPAVADRRRPLFRAREMMGEQRRAFVRRVRVRRASARPIAPCSILRW